MHPEHRPDGCSRGHSAPFEAAKHERMAYPRPIVDQLSEVLQASTQVYAEAKRQFGDLQMGFLERI